MPLRMCLTSRFIIGVLCTLPLAAFSSQQATQNNPVMDGVNVDVCLIDPASHDYVRNSKGQDLIDIAYYLGINLFRLTDGGCTHGKASGSAWKRILPKMAANGITAIVTTEPPMKSDEMTLDSVKYITSLVIDNKLGAYANIYGIDVINEPVLSDNNVSSIKQAIQQIKTVYPNLRVSVGGWRTKPGSGACPATSKDKYCWNKAEDGKIFSGLLDYYSAHIYGYDRPLNGPYPDPFTHTAQFLDTMLPFTEGKPIIIEEYGAANGIAVTDQQGLGTPELQANATDGVLRAVRVYRNKNVIGSTQWAFYNRSYQTGTPGWEIVLDSDTLLPAAYIIQKYSRGKSDKDVTVPMSIRTKAHIFRNTDNGVAVSLQQDDIAGFILNLDKTKNYFLTIDNPSMFTQTEPFTHKEYRNYYTATLHASASGTTKVKVMQNKCVENCQVFQITLTVLPRN